MASLLAAMPCIHVEMTNGPDILPFLTGVADGVHCDVATEPIAKPVAAIADWVKKFLLFIYNLIL